MNRINIALLAGGDSSEREVSLGSAQQVATSLDDKKYNVYLVDIMGREWNYVTKTGKKYPVDKNDFSVTVAGEKTVFDYALIMIHGTPGEDGRLQGYLDIMGVQYSSCGLTSSVVTFDKATTKCLVREAGITIARQVFIRPGDIISPQLIVEELGMPLFVKPNASGSSCGVTKVNLPGDLDPAIQDAFEESDNVIVEEFVDGREIACGIYSDEGEPVVLPLTEIISKKDFFDYQAKYTPGFSEEPTPADIDQPVAEKIREMTKTVYRVCGCRGLVRVDYIVRPDGTPVFIEANTIPGMSAGSIVPKQAAAAGMTMGELMDIIIRETFSS